jgi:hypothetical protein
MFNPADYISQVFLRPRENADDYFDTAIVSARSSQKHSAYCKAPYFKTLDS